ncbi:MAG TPA: hypothetical protein VMM76_26005 [Pirellulaceae bacterium]|nr:hypothetical protein [Pirellulaceae bacterium]
MKNLRGSVLTLLAAIVVASVANEATAQLPPPGLAGSMPLPTQGVPQSVIMPPQAMYNYNMPQPAGYVPAGYGPATYNSPGMAMQPSWGVQPTSYAAPQPFPSMEGMSAPAGYEMGGYGGGYAGGGCASCGGGGCGTCSGYGGSGYGGSGYGGSGYGGSGYGGPSFAERFISRLLPYAEGGQCAPRLYDITMDGIYLSRDKASRTVDFASDGINGDIILSTDDLDFDDDLGFRLTASKQIFAGATLEFTYLGLLDWSAAAVNRPAEFEDDIFSVLSDFGTNPAPDPNVPGSGGFDQTDRAREHRISSTSSIDNFELNIRKRFTAPNCRLQYSWLAGVRYLYLLEDFEYFTLGGDDDLVQPGLQSRGSMDYDVQARNSLTGLQVGGDAWLNLVPGVNVGGDIKAGVYGNYVNQTTNILATTSDPAGDVMFAESVNNYDLAMIADANMYFMWRLGPHWTVRAGYNFMFIEGVALGPENVNAVVPAFFTGGVPGAVRVSSLNEDGNVFYHGGFAGLEFVW